jgi:hypothetical protein
MTNGIRDLSADDLARLLELMRGADSVELKLTVPEAERNATVSAEIPDDVRRDTAFSIEVDAMPGGYVCSGSFKGTTDNEHVREVAAGGRRIKSLFSKGQRAFYKTHAPDGPDLDYLVPLGPLNVLKLKYMPEKFPRKVTVEAWFYPDGSRILELSTKCAPNEAFQAASEARAFLSTQGISIAANQHTKTRTALDYFASTARKG